MKTINSRLVCLFTLIGCLLAFAGASPVLADYAVEFHNGPDTMVMGVNEFGQLHGTLVNTGTSSDTYTMTVVADQPANWTMGVCYGGVCYPPTQSVFTVPMSGVLAPGEEIIIDFDVTTLTDIGSATYEVNIVSNNDPGVTASGEYYVYMPTEMYAIELTFGDNRIEGADVFEFYSFHGLLYNAGTLSDTYRLTMTRNLPENWMSSFCVNGVCYPPTQDTIDIPVGGGSMPSAGVVELDIDFTTMTDEGTGAVTVTVVSLSDGAIQASELFLVTTETVDVDDTPLSSAVVDLRAVPNPFNPRADIRFAVGGDIAAPATVDILDVSGRCIRTLHTGTLTPGAHSITWDGMTAAGQPAAAGVYMASVRVNNEQHMVKMTLAK